MSSEEAGSPGWDEGGNQRPRRQAKQPDRYKDAVPEDELMGEDGDHQGDVGRRLGIVPRSASSSPCSSPGPIRKQHTSRGLHAVHGYGRSAPIGSSHNYHDSRTFFKQEDSGGNGYYSPGTAVPDLHMDDDEDEDDDDDDDVSLIEQLLPGHKIARGRGRRKQLEKMSDTEKRAEKEARMEKMRVSARECRLRKKNNIATLEAKLEEFEVKDKRNRTMITRLKDEVRRLQDHLRVYGGGNQGGGNQAVETYTTVAQSVATLANMYPDASKVGSRDSKMKAIITTTTAANKPSTTITTTTANPAHRHNRKRGRTGLTVDTSKFTVRAAQHEAVHRATPGEAGTVMGGIFSKHLSNVVASQRQEQHVSMSPITPRLSLDSIVESGFLLQTPNSPNGGPAFNFNIDNVEQMMTGGLGVA